MLDLLFVNSIVHDIMKGEIINIASSDSFLFDELKKGKVKAFDILFEKHYENLCRFAFSFIHEADMAQSLVQNVFIKIWERRFVLGEIKNAGAYLTTMVRNQCLDYLKEQQVFDHTEQSDKNNAFDFSTDQIVLANNFEERLVIALSTLPPRCKLAFEYSRFDNMTNREIASKMDISIKGVEALIGRSLKLLRIELREFLPSFEIKDITPILLFLKYSKKVFL